MSDADRLDLFPRPRAIDLVGFPSPMAASDGALEVEETRSSELPAQGYELRLQADDRRLLYADDAGLRYGRSTLEQLRDHAGRLPALRIRDWPDFAVRGYMLDISRDRVPKRATLERVVELCDRLRLNHLQLYTEHTYAYPGHEIVWRDASPMRAADIRWLDAECAARGIELSANQNSFGHMGRWLKHDRYRELAETPEGFEMLGGHRPPGVLAPSDASLALVCELWDELLPNFRSRRVNVGCDETFELGKGRSREAVERLGRGRVYCDFLARILRELQRRGCEVLFWGDVLKNHPELVEQLPDGPAVALAWHYEAPIDPAGLPDRLFDSLVDLGITRDSLRGFAGHVPAFADSGLPFWVCPGTSTWNTLIGRLPNARANLLDAAEVGRQRGAGGYLITDWGDNGHMQPPSVSIPPLVYGAGLAWGLEANRDVGLADVVDRRVFGDPTRELGAALESLGALHARTGLSVPNASPLFTALVDAPLLPTTGQTDVPGVERVIEEIGEAIEAIDRSQPSSTDAAVVRRELAQAARLARLGAARILEAAGGRPPPMETLDELIEEQRRCWLARSEPGGLTDSVVRLRPA